MRLLIITAAYAPFIHPRAHRWTSVAEHWAATGHEVHVVTTRRRDCADTEPIHGVMVHRVGFDSLASRIAYTFSRSPLRGGVGEAVSKPGRMMRWFTALYQSVWKRFVLPDDAAFWIAPALKKSLYLLENQHFDAVVTVYQLLLQELYRLLFHINFHHLLNVYCTVSMLFDRQNWWHRCI